MQLIVKLYKDKPHRLGIIYPSEYQAGKSYEALLGKGEPGPFHALIELGKNGASLKLKTEQGDLVASYKELEFKAEQLKRLQAFVGERQTLHFAHTYKKGNEMFVPKVRFRNPELIVISHYELLCPEGF
ncbi:MAG: hypothetical protein JWO09_1329 [Bacteroidetes bacterium]|nr:hypothetical protein [Bacteroidota bacterium]